MIHVAVMPESGVTSETSRVEGNGHINEENESGSGAAMTDIRNNEVSLKRLGKL